MKTLPLILLTLCIALTGCKQLDIGGKYGLKAQAVTPPENSAVRITVRSIGIHAGQNQATQTPEVQIGYQSATYDRVPTSTNKVYIAPTKGGIGVNTEGFVAGIKETYETGEKQ